MTLKIEEMTAEQLGLSRDMAVMYPVCWAVVDEHGNVVTGADGCREIHTTPEAAQQFIRMQEESAKKRVRKMRRTPKYLYVSESLEGECGPAKNRRHKVTVSSLGRYCAYINTYHHTFKVRRAGPDDWAEWIVEG